MSAAPLLAGVAGVSGTAALADAITLWRARAADAGARRRRLPQPRLAGRLAAPAAPRDLAGRVAAAGAAVAVEDVMALKCCLVAGALLAALVVSPALPGRLGTLLLIAGPAAGFVLPDLALARRARLRAQQLRAEAPDVLDRLRLAVDAGLSPARAIDEAGRHGRGPLALELRALAAAAELGVARDEALARLRRRCPLAEVEALAAALTRSHRHGAPLGPALAALAEATRAERGRRIHERAQRAAPKIQLVVALLLVPAALLLVAAGMLAGLR